MSSGREIITIQLGSYANSVGAHFWNLERASFRFEDDASSTSCASASGGCGSHSAQTDTVARWTPQVDHSLLFRECRSSHSSQTTFTPRLIAVDLLGGLGEYPRRGLLAQYETLRELQRQAQTQAQQTVTQSSLSTPVSASTTGTATAAHSPAKSQSHSQLSPRKREREGDSDSDRNGDGDDSDRAGSDRGTQSASRSRSGDKQSAGVVKMSPEQLLAAATSRAHGALVDVSSGHIDHEPLVCSAIIFCTIYSVATRRGRGLGGGGRRPISTHKLYPFWTPDLPVTSNLPDYC